MMRRPTTRWVIRGGGRGAGWFAAVVAVTVAARSFAAEQSVWEQPPQTMPVVVAGGAGQSERLGDAAAFAVPKGFVVDRVFAVPLEQLGSWVCLTVDPRGRIIASDQGGKGLVRITPAPLDGSGTTRVERIPVAITSAQGLLWAFDALYAVCNGGPGSGLYRMTDADGDDMPDTVKKLRSFQGDGEHGPHAVHLSPDGTRLVIICGNHTKTPFAVTDVTPPQTMAGIRPNQRRVKLAADGSSRLPSNWDEDQIITRMWDSNGHAAGLLAPGGYVVSTDRDGTSWELWSAGYRNPYEMAFNADGELFVYDADMEWDFGMPWYRPTRVNHATSGSDLGWRSGSGKWSPAFPDSLPAMLDIGPGSPVGVTFGYGAAFPAEYQRALFIADWTFGTIYALHLTPKGSTYEARKEEFVARTPLPLTDLVVGADGAIYFAVGGRGGQSELYRIRYAGPASTAPADAHDSIGKADRGLRQALEALHGPQADPRAAVAKALPQLAHPDRFIRHAARVALEHQPIDLWLHEALAIDDPMGRITGALAAARQAEPSAQPLIFAALDSIDPAALDTAGRLDLARACELTIVRLGLPPADVVAAIVDKTRPFFPSGSFDLDRELASLLVGLRAPGIVPQLVGMLGSPTGSADRTNLASDEDALRRLAERNDRYGSSVRTALEKRSDLLQIHYAYVLRTVKEKEAWTMEDRKAYLEWFARAREWGGGNSFQKFLTAIETESLDALSDTERLALEAAGVRRPYVPPPLPSPKGPGRKWTLDEVLAAAARGMEPGSRDFNNGKQAFAAARCIVCHRFGGDGGSTGPDLTQAGGRFQLRDLAEAIVDPSRVVSDQYRASVVQTDDGRVVTGRIVSEMPDRITIVTDPEKATTCVEIRRASIEEITPSPVSLMPAGLLDQLNEDEVLDLVAYVLSRGKRKGPLFTKTPR